jgi:hypothetical protein
MPRKRTSTNTPSPENTNVISESPPPAAAAAALEPAAPANDNTPAANDNQPSFAERVGQKQRPSAPDPFGIASDYIAGVRLFESRQDRQMAIKFGDGSQKDKPSQPVIDKVKEAGYRWNPVDRIWAHPVGSDSAMSTRIEAERLYQEVRQMIRQEKGFEAGQDVPF